jgi:hypothetical protein
MVPVATPAPSPIDQFIGRADVTERHQTLVRAPAPLVFDVAEHFDLQAIPVVRAIFWLRSVLLRSDTRDLWRKDRGLVAETAAMGWGALLHEPGRLYVAGALAQPWLADVRFTPVPPGEFSAFAAPDMVKIVWTIEADPVGPALTRFRSETRVVATDEPARRKFRRYWRIFGMGIVLIRWLLLPAVRREAERQYEESCASSHSPS